MVGGSFGGVTLTNNTFTGNRTQYSGGGAFPANGAILTNNTFTGNYAGFHGGGVNVHDPTFTNNTITGNSCDNQGRRYLG